jgi:hypothetical protein
MQNSVAIYSVSPSRADTRTPAPWIFRRGFGRRVDVGGGGLMLRHGRSGGFDVLTAQKPTVKAVSKRQDVEMKRQIAIIDDLTAKSVKPSYTCTHTPAYVDSYVCHIVKSSNSYIYIYQSITYIFDTSLTAVDSLLCLNLAADGQNHCLSGWGSAHGGFYGAA